MEQHLKDYLTYCKEEDILPSKEDYLIYLVDNGIESINYEISIRDKRVIYIYAKRYLLTKAGRGGRNSHNYILLLKELKEEDETKKEEAIQINFNNDSKHKLPELNKED